MSEYVKVTRNGHVLEVILDKPKVNAIDHEMSRQLGQAFSQLRDDPELRVGILSAAGEKIFSAGDMRRGQSLVVWAIREGRQAAHAVDAFLMGASELPR